MNQQSPIGHRQFVTSIGGQQFTEAAIRDSHYSTDEKNWKFSIAIP